MLANTGLLKMEPPPEVLPPPPCPAPGFSCLRRASLRRFSRRHMTRACLRRGLTSGGGCLFNSPMLTNEVRYMGTHPSLPCTTTPGGRLPLSAKQPHSSAFVRRMSARRVDATTLRGLLPQGRGLTPRRLAMLANTGLSKMEPPLEVLPPPPCVFSRGRGWLGRFIAVSGARLRKFY